MASEAIKTKGVGVFPRSVMMRIFLFNLLVGLPLLFAAVTFGAFRAASFGFGFFLGLGNMLWLLRIARNGVHMPPKRAGRYVFLNYLIRFSLTIFVLIAVVTKGLFMPVPLMAGIVVPVATTIVLTIKTAKEFSL